MKNRKFNPHSGHYKVGDQIIYCKPEAMLWASKTKQFLSWDFNTKELINVDWTAEPEVSLKELYRMRAQQLRDKYDWIRIECSGGADSSTVLFSFLLNGIHVDEIVFRYPGTGTENSKDSVLITRATNHISEYDYAAMPLFNWVKTNFPKTLAHVHDYSDSMLKNKTIEDETWIYYCNHYMQPTWADKHNQVDARIHKDVADTGKSIGVVYGVDKPRLGLINDHWFFYFADLQGAFPNPTVGEYTNITSELFYWSPDFPELMVKQAHVVKNWFDMPSNCHLREVARFPGQGRNRSTYENIVKSIVYTDYDLNTFQTEKPFYNFYNEVDDWFHKNFKNTKLYTGWRAGVDYLVENIDPMYLDFEFGQPIGLKVIICPYFYYLGTSKATTNVPAFRNSISGYTVPTDLASFLKIIKNRKIIPGTKFFELDQ
jgi:hypothetical protein